MHQNGTLVLDSIQVGFVNDRGEIHHSYIDSLHVYQLDSVSFAGDIPELQELHGTPVAMNLNRDNNRIILEPHTPEFYAIFSAYHTLYAIDYYRERFGNLLNFKEKEQYRELELYLGDYINCSASQYILNPRARVSPTVIYHEVGHRAFCQLDDTLAIGNVFSMLHNGLMEYFTVTMAGHPVVGEGMLRGPLLRDASKPVQYPRDKYYYEDFLRDLEQSLSDSTDCHEALRKLYTLNKKRASRCTTRILMTHQTGMLITHPLWKLREKAGAGVADSLVVHSMKKMGQVLKSRNTYLKDAAPGGADQPAWFDFFYALLRTDQQLYGGRHEAMIRKAFKSAGYHTKWVRSP
ncbi:MAG: hypothetical protein KGY60_03840 [Bacteroidales bacterium]|nr:hypothetical protein [Bacteroidales bacterium]